MKKTKTIIEHELEYWHIPKFSLWSIIGLIISGILAYLNLSLINLEFVGHTSYCEKFIGYAYGCENNYILEPSSLINIYPILGEYILISLMLISLVAIFKKGYKNLNSFEEGGVIVGLILGLIVGLTLGLTLGLMGPKGMIGGVILGLIVGLIVGIIMEACKDNQI